MNIFQKIKALFKTFRMLKRIQKAGWERVSPDRDVWSRMDKGVPQIRHINELFKEYAR